MGRVADLAAPRGRRPRPARALTRPGPLLGRLRALRETQLGGLAGDSLYTALWQGAVTAADLVQVALIANMLGVREYGRLALVMSVVLIFGQLLDVRVGAAATTFGSRWMTGDRRGFVGVFQLTFLVDLSTGVLSFLLVVAAAPLLAPAVVGDGATGLVVLFALSLLIGTVDESSTSLLRLHDRFRLLALSSIGLEAVRVGLVALALVLEGTLSAVLLALIAAQLLRSLTYGGLAVRVLRRFASGIALRQRHVGAVDDRREMLRMMFHTNTVSYARLAQVQLPTVVVGALAGPTQAGLYKIGMAVAAFIGRLSDPAYAAVLPRLAKLFTAGAREQARRLVAGATKVATPVMLLVLAAVVAVRLPLLEILGDEEARAAGGVVIVGAVGQAVNGILFWNVGVLYALGHSRFVSRVAIGCTIFQTAVIVPLVMWEQALGAAVAVLASLLLTNLLVTVRAVRLLRRPA